MPIGTMKSRIHCSLDLGVGGRQIGDLQLRHSDNRQPLGFYPVPIICIAGVEKGPTMFLIAGVHGDEFEGPVALMRLVHSLPPDEIRGRVIILPALNMPAIDAASRISPLDQANMNRAFPGDPDGGPTAMLAHYVETVLIPQCDAVIDLHAGGKASVFAASALASRDEDAELFENNLALARAFGAPLIWLLGAYNDNRSVNAAAARKKVPMIAAELGGGGGCEPMHAGLAETGVRRCLGHLGILPTVPEAAPPSRLIEIASSAQNIFAPCRGLFDRNFAAGDEVKAGQDAGFIHMVGEPSRPPVRLVFPAAGIVLAHGNRGIVDRGEMLAMVAHDAEVGARADAIVGKGVSN